MSLQRDHLRWNGWGRLDTDDGLGERGPPLWAWLQQELGLPSLAATPPQPMETVPVPPPRLSRRHLTQLAKLSAPDRVVCDGPDRIRHAVGKSYPDLLLLRTGAPLLPDAVVYPLAPEVEAILRWAASASVAVVPFGGGTSVVGGVAARGGPGHRAVLALDTTRMEALVAVDEASRTATLEAGISGPDLERLLQERGWTLGHYPQSFEFSTLGGWIATRGAGQQSNKYGKAEDWLVAAEVATAHGALRTLNVPASAAGPDLNQIIAGSEGTLGVITRATVRIHPLPERRAYHAWLLRDWSSGAAAVRDLVQAGLDVATTRLSDSEETRFLRALSGRPRGAKAAVESWLARRGYDRPCMLLVGAEGENRAVAGTLAEVRRRIGRHGAFHLGARPGRSWYARRFHLPYLRDPILDRGLGVDTLETAAPWSSINALRESVSSALLEAAAKSSPVAGGRGAVLCHLSHSYPDGASLYFTFLWPRDDADALGQWQHLKAAAMRAFRMHGGTVSHHHGVGTDNLEWLRDEQGPGAAWLHAVKQATDPEGVLNPGKLVLP